MNKALILGGYGQDGQLMQELLRGKGYEVFAPSREECDITDLGGLWSYLDSLNDLTEVYNFAGQSSITRSFEEPEETWKVNAYGVQSLLTYLLNSKKDVKFFQAGSIESLYGTSPYAYSKDLAAKMTQDYANAGLHAVCANLTNHESYLRPPYFFSSKVIDWAIRYKQQPTHTDYAYPKSYYKWTPQLTTLSPLALGNLHIKKDWMDARDVVEAAHLSLQQDRPLNFNLSSGRQHTGLDFITQVFKELDINPDPSLVYIDPALQRIETDAPLIDPGPAYKYLGWSPRYSFEDMISNMVKQRCNRLK